MQSCEKPKLSTAAGRMNARLSFDLIEGWGEALAARGFRPMACLTA